MAQTGLHTLIAFNISAPYSIPLSKSAVTFFHLSFLALVLALSNFACAAAFYCKPKA